MSYYYVIVLALTLCCVANGCIPTMCDCVGRCCLNTFWFNIWFYLDKLFLMKPAKYLPKKALVNVSNIVLGAAIALHSLL